MPILIVSLVIGIIMVTAVILPLSSEYAEAKTFTNEGYFYMSQLDDESEYKLFWDHTKPYEVTINDTDVIQLSGITGYQAVTLVGSDKFTFRFFNATDNPRVQLYGGAGFGFIGASVSSEIDMEVVVSNGSITFTSTAESANTTTADLPSPTYAITTAGDYVMKKANSPAYVLEDTSIIVLCGFTESGSASAGVYASGTVEDGLEYVLFRPSSDSETAVFSNETITYTDVSGYVNLVSLEKVDFSVTVTAGTLNPTYTYFIVPAEVSADPDNPAAYKSLVMVIPLMAFVVLVVAAAAMIYYKKD